MTELGPEARAILDAGRHGDDPAPADRVRLRAAVLRSIAMGGAIGAASSAAAEGAAGAEVLASAAKPLIALGWKIAVGLAMAGAVYVGSTQLDAGSSPGQPVRARERAPDTGAAPRSRFPSGETAKPPSTGADRASTSTESPAGAHEPAPALGPAHRPPVDVQGSAPAPPIDDGPSPGKTARATAIASVRAAPPPSAAAPASPPAAVEAEPAQGGVAAPAGRAEDTLDAETRHLGEVHRALQGGDAARALALLDAQSATYADGQLREERAAARVLALCKLGRTDQAGAARTAFLREYPRSPLGDRVRAACATPVSPGPGR